MSQPESKIGFYDKLKQVKPMAIPELEETRDRFRDLYILLHPNSASQAIAKYEAERFHFRNLVFESRDLQACTPLSLYGAFIDTAVHDLSFDPAMKHVYLIAESHNVGTKENKVWEKRARAVISGQGELILRMRQGHVKYVDNPVLVYSCDELKSGTKDGRFYIEHNMAWPRPADATIIASYIRIERFDGSSDYKMLSILDIERFKRLAKGADPASYSEDRLPGMIEAKTIKHAFRGFPKLKLGTWTGTQSDTSEPGAEGFNFVALDLDSPIPKISKPAAQEEIKKDEPKQMQEPDPDPNLKFEAQKIPQTAEPLPAEQKKENEIWQAPDITKPNECLLFTEQDEWDC